jgi:hypothetical protein
VVVNGQLQALKYFKATLTQRLLLLLLLAGCPLLQCLGLSLPEATPAAVELRFVL